MYSITEPNIDTFAEIFGLILGDGWLSKNKRKYKNSFYYVYQSGVSADIEDLIKVKNDLKNIIGNIGKANIKTTKTYSPKYNISGTTNMISFNSNVSKILEYYDMPIGRRVEQSFFIPKWIIESSNKTKIAFLSGLYAAEGDNLIFQKNNKTIKAPSLVLTKRIALKEEFEITCKQILSLFNDIGIDITLSYKNVLTKFHNNIYAIFTIKNNNDNIKKFISTLPMNYCARKKITFEKVYQYLQYKENVRKNTIQLYDNIINDGKTLPIYKIAKKYGLPWSTVNNYIKGYRKQPSIRKFLTYSEYSSIKNPLNGETLN